MYSVYPLFAETGFSYFINYKVGRDLKAHPVQPATQYLDHHALNSSDMINQL